MCVPSEGELRRSPLCWVCRRFGRRRFLIWLIILGTRAKDAVTFHAGYLPPPRPMENMLISLEVPAESLDSFGVAQ